MESLNDSELHAMSSNTLAVDECKSSLTSGLIGTSRSMIDIVNNNADNGEEGNIEGISQPGMSDFSEPNVSSSSNKIGSVNLTRSENEEDALSNNINGNQLEINNSDSLKTSVSESKTMERDETSSSNNDQSNLSMSRRSLETRQYSSSLPYQMERNSTVNNLTGMRSNVVRLGSASVFVSSSSSLMHNDPSVRSTSYPGESTSRSFRTAIQGLQSPHTKQRMLAATLKRRADQLQNALIEQDRLSQQQKAKSSKLRNNTTSILEGAVQPNHSRRFKVNDYVLVRNMQSKWANLVNRYGFPPGEGDSEEERNGPYQFLLATITKIHFEEIKTYYTVVRCDTGTEQRADLEFMEPLRTPKGELAALKAATENVDHLFQNHSTLGDNGRDVSGWNSSVHSHRSSHFTNRCTAVCEMLACPFFWLRDLWDLALRGRILSYFHFIRCQARLILHGKSPYVCRMRITVVNLVVVCSTWFMFIDQARLAFFPPSSDRALAIVNLFVWTLLMLELLFEVFIRPKGFSTLVVSEKAFSPSTVLFINSFHFWVEMMSLLTFIPEFNCILQHENCSDRYKFSFHNAALLKTIGPTRLDAAYGYAFFALIRLRVIGLVRHWKNMWVSNTFIHQKGVKSKMKQRPGLLANIIPPGSILGSKTPEILQKSSISSSSTVSIGTPDKSAQSSFQSKEHSLTNASNIGTALMVINSYRTMAIVWAITGVFPVFLCLMSSFRNVSELSMTHNLHDINLMTTDTSEESCEFLRSSISTWAMSLMAENKGWDSPSLLSIYLTPYRCNFSSYDPVTITLCEQLLEVELYNKSRKLVRSCKAWIDANESGNINDPNHVAISMGIRVGSITSYTKTSMQNFTSSNSSITMETNFSVSTSFDRTPSVTKTAIVSLILQLCLLIAVLGGLSALRRDAEVLVLGPLRRMLKIVARYARNPLVPPKVNRVGLRRSRYSSTDDSRTLSDDDDDYDDYDDDDVDDFALGSYETEQLITAVTKITDLLRKCWGVAGADIISTNLASREGALTEVFNPTVPGKSVYALFGFAAIGGFDNAVRNLGGDIMPLINDIAAVLHGEVFRWGFRKSGQCNKNLGGAFLMVFRIGLVKDVVEKLEEAKNVVFNMKNVEGSSAVKRKKNRSHQRNPSFGTITNSSQSTILLGSQSALFNRKKERNATTKAMSLSLQSLPGITNFTDRAVIGMLKSYAGIYRDKKVLGWNDDFRLGAGVGAFSINMIYGMDAGWAVEGAVGSEYKIDATYLSPHVNMASRMTSACKQYGVTMLLSQAVQELMSDVAQNKLRHIDTVTVKGSSVKQKIYTYDARVRGVDFFLYSRSDEQADFDAENVSPKIWHDDQDLKAMRQHVTEDFLVEFKAGHKAYISGDWPSAITRLERANDIMLQTVFEEGYLECEFDAIQLCAGGDAKKAEEELRLENGDGPSMYLINLMKSYGGVAPSNWEGWHPLTRK